MNVNRIKLSGMVLSNPTFFSVQNDLRIYSVEIASVRFSGLSDTIVCFIPEELVTRFYAGCKIGVYGSVQIYHHPENMYRIGKKNLLFVNVTSTYKWRGEDENFVKLTGTISRPVKKRETSLGKVISEITVEHRFETHFCHIPCIAWNDNASKAAEAKIGENVICLGRLQSRDYEKNTEDGIRIITTHEICVTKFDYNK